MVRCWALWFYSLPGQYNLALLLYVCCHSAVVASGVRSAGSFGWSTLRHCFFFPKAVVQNMRILLRCTSSESPSLELSSLFFYPSHSLLYFNTVVAMVRGNIFSDTKLHFMPAVFFISRYIRYFLSSTPSDVEMCFQTLILSAV